MNQPPDAVPPATAVPETSAHSPSEKPSLRLVDLQSRFLFPFFFDRHRAKEASEALKRSTPVERQHVWACADPRGAYTEEVLGHAAEFLFPQGDGAGCSYLRATDAATQPWFQGVRVRMDGGAGLPVSLVHGVGVELFLTDYGVGVLSLTLTPTHHHRPSDPGITVHDAVTFNYRLAHRQEWSAAKLYVPHPADDPEALARLCESDRAKVQPAPSSEAPLAERLGKRGGSFTLGELVGDLLHPLEPLGLKLVQPMFSVYTAARFGPEVDLGLRDIRDRFAPVLSALTQVEEADHAGAPEGTVGVPNAVLNRRHWAAVGQLAAAHVVADQPCEHPFNDQRVPLVRDKYFVQYLMALLQRLIVHRTISQAGATFLLSTGERRQAVERLRADLLDFAVGGYFTQVSTRHSQHRFYQVAREGLDVPNAWEEARRAITDIEAKMTLERQEQVAGDMAENLQGVRKVAGELDELGKKMEKNLGVIADVQQMIHRIEIFIVSVYFAHLFHMGFADNEHTKGLLGGWFTTLGVFITGGLAFIGTWLIVRNVERRSGHR